MVARGGQFVFAQTIGDVIKFLGLDVKQQERLAPAQLMQKMDLVLPPRRATSARFPAAELDKPFRNRNRPIRVLAHHVFRIVEGFLESMDDGALLTYERIMRETPPRCAPARISRATARRYSRARSAGGRPIPTATARAPMQTYFGTHPVHVVLERTVWHPAQHTRQLMLILESLGIRPDRPLTAADLAGLPLPEKAWDED